MLPLFKGVVRGLRRLTAHLAPPADCPICLDQLPVIGLPEAADGAQETHAKLLCRHKFCADCIRPYVEMKIKAREVDDDQLVCPVVECKKSIHERDLARLGGDALLLAYRTTLKRLRDERNPNARWCPRAGCGELIVCEAPGNFTCPSCGAVGCFKCRGSAHRFGFFCRARLAQDASYTAWEKSVGDRRTVRSCPQCQMRIWKTEGCNHMTCSSCRHEYCWVCDSAWDRSHYSCYEVAFLGNAVVTRLAHHAVGYAVIIAVVLVISCYGFATFLGVYTVFCMAVSQWRARQRVLQGA